MSRGRLVPVWVLIILLSGMFLMGQGSDCSWGPGVQIPDPQLENVIRDDLDKLDGDICAYELSRMKSVYAPSRSILDLSGLEYCISLDFLGLWENQISDISPLAGLTELEYLNLESNQITDVSPLAGLVNLRELYLMENQVTDISSLTGLTELFDLRLDGNQISDISPLVENPGIDRYDIVSLIDNPLSSTSCTVYVPELKSRGVHVLAVCPD